MRRAPAEPEGLPGSKSCTGRISRASAQLNQARSSTTPRFGRGYSLNAHPLREGALLPVGSTLAGLVWPNYAPIDADQLQPCIAHAENHGSPSAEWLLIRDANSMCAGHDLRRAVLDAGLAAASRSTPACARGTAAKLVTRLLRECQSPRDCRVWRQLITRHEQLTTAMEPVLHSGAGRHRRQTTACVQHRTTHTVCRSGWADDAGCNPAGPPWLSRSR